MSRVTISMKAARAWLAGNQWPAYDQVRFAVARADRDAKRRAMEPKRKPRKPSPPLSAADVKEWTRLANQAGVQTKARKRDRRASIREAVVKRAMDAGGFCECGCGEQVRDDRKTPVYPEARGEMDHFWGRGKGRPPESLETCWFLRPACHLAKTRNQPDARMWLQKYVAHCARYGYSQEQARATSRLAFVEARSMLGAGLKRERFKASVEASAAEMAKRPDWEGKASSAERGEVQQRHRDEAEAYTRKLEEKVHKAVFGGAK